MLSFLSNIIRWYHQILNIRMAISHLPLCFVSKFLDSIFFFLVQYKMKCTSANIKIILIFHTLLHQIPSWFWLNWLTMCYNDKYVSKIHQCELLWLLLYKFFFLFPMKKEFNHSPSFFLNKINFNILLFFRPMLPPQQQQSYFKFGSTFIQFSFIHLRSNYNCLLVYVHSCYAPSILVLMYENHLQLCELFYSSIHLSVYRPLVFIIY